MSHLRIHGLCRLTRAPELKETKTGTLAAFGGVTNEKYGDTETTAWNECIAFGKTGENIVKFFGKGDLIYVEGKLTLDSWEDKDGNKRSKHKIIVLGFEFTGGNKAGATKPEAPPAADDDDDIPF